MAVLVQAYWAQVGVTLNIHANEWGTFSEVAMSNNADVFGMSWTWYPDPYFFLNKLLPLKNLAVSATVSTIPAPRSMNCCRRH